MPLSIAVGVVHAGTVTFEMANTLAMIGYSQGKKGHQFNIIGAESCLVDDNANNVIEAAQGMKCDYLFFLDADMEFTGTGDVLDYMISMDKDVVCGLYFQGRFPYRPNIYNFTQEIQVKSYSEIPDGLFRVEAAAAGFCLIKKKVLDLFTPKVNKKFGKPFDPLVKKNTVILRADAAFFWRLKQLGVEVWVNSGIPLAHIKSNKITGDHFAKSKALIEKAQNAQSTPDNG
jgi:hypothetical protein